MKSYSSEWKGLRSFAFEAINLYKARSQNVARRVRESVANAKDVEARIAEHYELRLRECDMLEIGPGQFLSQMVYFSPHNRVKGVDLDVIVQGFSAFGFLRMLHANGAIRTGKTIARKMLGIDHRYNRELKAILGIKRIPELNVHFMDMRKMSFPDESFDCVYSRAVLHHCPEPDVALAEIVRVLRQRGVVYLAIHPYTSNTGCLDPRVFNERKDELGYWPHLRPQLWNSLHQSNSYLNRLRISDWERLFADKMPGAKCLLVRDKTEGLREVAQSLHGRGELTDYTLEELLAGELVVLWRKGQ
jgi:SAM-dependent methyltransferase